MRMSYEIHIDSSISFVEHYAYILNKASSMLGLINNQYTIKSLYCSFVQSVFDYNSTI